MTDIVLKNDYSELEKQGRELYGENEEYKNIANVMEHPEFRKFFGTHFRDWSSTKTILTFMKLYEAIEKESDIILTKK
jgi:hypothetical protein